MQLVIVFSCLSFLKRDQLSLVRSLSPIYLGSLTLVRYFFTWSPRVHYLLPDHCHMVSRCIISYQIIVTRSVGALSLVRSSSSKFHYFISDPHNSHPDFIISYHIFITQPLIKCNFLKGGHGGFMRWQSTGNYFGPCL